MPQLSVVVVSYNTQALLRESLASIWGDMAERDVEVLVVDNASTMEARRWSPESFRGLS